MKIVRVILIVFVTCVLVAALVIGGIFLYMKFYGKEILENALSDMIGAKVKFEGVSLNLEEYKVNFRGVSVVSKIDFEENILNAEKFTLVLNEERFRERREVVFDRIIIEKGTLNITKNTRGGFNISYNEMKEPKYDPGTAYAQEFEPIGFFNFTRTIKDLTITDSVINFRDLYVPNGPFAITCDELNLHISSGDLSAEGSIAVLCELSFRIPNDRYRDGRFFLKAGMAAYKYWVDMELAIQTEYIDVMQFLPYFKSYTPFNFRDGLFSSNTKFRMHSNKIDSLTTMVFHRLNFTIDQSKEGGQFLGVAINRLVPYLRAGGGEIIFDFVIEGTADDPRVGVGPRVKFAMGMVVMEELGNLMQQLQQLQR